MTAAQRRAAVLQGKRKFVAAGVSLDDIVRLLDQTLLREEDLRGRQTWVVQSEARKDAVGESKHDANVLCYRYTHWIDRESQVIAQEDWEIIRSGADTEPGTTSRAVYAAKNGSPWFLQSLEGHFITKGPKGVTRNYERRACSEDSPNPPATLKSRNEPASASLRPAPGAVYRAGTVKDSYLEQVSNWLRSVTWSGITLAGSHVGSAVTPLLLPEQFRVRAPYVVGIQGGGVGDLAALPCREGDAGDGSGQCAWGCHDAGLFKTRAGQGGLEGSEIGGNEFHSALGQTIQPHREFGHHFGFDQRARGIVHCAADETRDSETRDARPLRGRDGHS